MASKQRFLRSTAPTSQVRWKMGKQHEFDKAYYKRFYNYPRIRVSDMKECAVLGDSVSSNTAFLRLRAGSE